VNRHRGQLSGREKKEQPDSEIEAQTHDRADLVERARLRVPKVISDVQQAEEGPPNADDTTGHRAAGDDRGDSCGPETEVESANISDEMFVEWAVRGHPVQPEPGEGRVEGVREAGRPDADESRKDCEEAEKYSAENCVHDNKDDSGEANVRRRLTFVPMGSS
jgi:hypothetical protein